MLFIFCNNQQHVTDDKLFLMQTFPLKLFPANALKMTHHLVIYVNTYSDGEII